MSKGETHVCIGCGKRDTDDRSMLCGQCLYARTPRRNAPDKFELDAEPEEIRGDRRRVLPGPHDDPDDAE